MLRKGLRGLIVLLGITLAVLYSTNLNVKEMELQLKQNLTDVAKQNAVVLKARIDTEYWLLEALANDLQGVTPDTIEAKLNNFKILMSDFGLKRFAFCFPDGTTYSTDSEVSDLSYRDFYIKGMEGVRTITGVMTDALRKDQASVNVMTIPVYDDSGNVSGVFGLAYDARNFNQSLEIESFDGQGYSCIMDSKGQIMSVMPNDTLAISENFFDEALRANPDNETTVAELRSHMEQREELSGTLYLTQKNYYHCVPVDLMDGSVTWYILTILPAETLHQRVAPIQLNQNRTIFCVGVFLALGATWIICAIMEQQKQMARLAYEDPVTHGANYTRFCQDMENRHNRQGYLIEMDILNFNNITVVAGEAASETVIVKVWEIISAALRKGELAGRVRDDMFLLFLTGSDEDKLVRRMEQISAQIIELAKELGVYGTRASYGIYQMSGTETIENAYSKARIAREEAAEKTEVNYVFYQEDSRVRGQQEKQLEESFGEALAKKEFEIWYQPKYSAAGSAIVGSEALVRWRRQSGDLISPGIFIPLFERDGMIVKLDEYMFESVCRQQKRWHEEGKTIYPVSVNMSRASVYCKDIEKRYGEIVQKYGISPEWVQLEITETAVEGKEDIRELLNKFRQMGIKILMDDFGTGYSSLATLSAHCFDTLKLDKSLIDTIGSKEGEILLTHIIRMGQQLGLKITAEGVEEKEQVTFLEHLKCDDIQGFYFSKPLCVKEYEELIGHLD